MTRVSKLFAALLMVPALAFTGTAFAVAEGQIEGGNIYRIKNVTKNSALTDPANADACDTLLYNVVAHNPGPGVVVDVRVKATLPTGVANTHTSTVTLSSINATPESTTDTATLNLSSSQSISYVAGSTELLDHNGNKMQNLPDGITQGGISMGNVRVSVNEKRFVQFKVKVSCPEQPKPVKLACVDLKVNKISNNRYDFTATGSAENTTIKSYVFTTKNSAGATVDTFTANTSATTAVYQFNQTTAGAYTVSVTVNSDKDSATSSACVKQVTVEAAPTPTPTPPAVQGKTTEELPNTGAGSVISLFAGASALGAAGHYAVRRFRG